MVCLSVLSSITRTLRETALGGSSLDLLAGSSMTLVWTATDTPDTPYHMDGPGTMIVLRERDAYPQAVTGTRIAAVNLALSRLAARW